MQHLSAILNQPGETNCAELGQHAQNPRMETGSDLHSHIAANRY